MELEQSVDKLQKDLDELKTLIGPRKPAPVPAESRNTMSLATIGAMFISAVVLLYFGAMLYVVATTEFPVSQKDNVAGLLWTLNTLAVGVVGYWVGSSVGSNMKTQIMENKK